MVTLSQNRLLAAVGMVVLAIVLVTIIGGIEFVPVLVLLALAISLMFYFVDTEQVSQDEGSLASDAAGDPIDELRTEFATGRIDDEEFDRRLDILLETETGGDRARGDPIRERH